MSRTVCPRLRVSGLGFQVSGFGFRGSGFGSRVSGRGFRISGFRVKPKSEAVFRVDYCTKAELRSPKISVLLLPTGRRQV